MIATEIFQRYQAGAGLRPLMAEYHMGPLALRRLLVSMGATLHPSSQDAANERPAQVKEEILACYQQGDSLVTLMATYHIGQHPLRRLLTAMGATIRPVGVRVHQVSREEASASQHKARERRMASGEKCQRCEILLRFDPGREGYCGECWEEVGNVDLVSQAAVRSDHPVLRDLSTFTARL